MAHNLRTPLSKGITWRLIGTALGMSAMLLSLVMQGGTGNAGLAAHATSQPGCYTFQETGKSVCGRFLQYWREHGGLAQQGFPISEVIGETSDVDGKLRTVQYFERAVFELHSEYAPPNDVLLSLLGSFRYRQKYPDGALGQGANSTAPTTLFPQTGKRIGGAFALYWQTHGGLAQQGYPISDEFVEKSDLNGESYVVQYFERAVFEYHQELPPPNNVLLSQLGRARYGERYAAVQPLAAPQPVPPAIASPTPRPSATITHTPAQGSPTRMPTPTAAPTQPPGSGQRCGAICNDGSRSNSTGSGTCSRHGGVREWVYCDLRLP